MDAMFWHSAKSLGCDFDTYYRYPYDPVDRIWMSDQAALAETTSLLQNVGSNVTSISTTRSVTVTSANDQPPQLVMQTAAVGNNGILSYRSRLNGFPSQAYAVSYFAEIQVLKPTDIRSFIFNTNIADPTFFDQNLNLQQDAKGPFMAFEPGYLNVTIPQYVDYSLTRTPNSTLNPIINALEIYKIVTKVSTTNYADGNFFFFLTNSSLLVKDMKFLSPSFQRKPWLQIGGSFCMHIMDHGLQWKFIGSR
jgi:hypothetical protein